MRGMKEHQDGYIDESSNNHQKEVISSDQESEINSILLKSVKSNENYQQPMMLMNTLCEARVAMELMASTAQKRQADIRVQIITTNMCWKYLEGNA
jgi:hypothetical protein